MVDAKLEIRAGKLTIGGNSPEEEEIRIQCPLFGGPSKEINCYHFSSCYHIHIIFSFKIL
jgi:hypothetical protein